MASDLGKVARTAVRNPAGMKIATLEADDDGGGIFALVPANQADGGVFLNTVENGGKLSIFGKGNEPPIWMFIGKIGDGFRGLCRRQLHGDLFLLSGVFAQSRLSVNPRFAAYHIFPLRQHSHQL